LVGWIFRIAIIIASTCSPNTHVVPNIVTTAVTSSGTPVFFVIEAVATIAFSLPFSGEILISQVGATGFACLGVVILAIDFVGQSKVIVYIFEAAEVRRVRNTALKVSVRGVNCMFFGVNKQASTCR